MGSMLSSINHVYSPEIRPPLSPQALRKYLDLSDDILIKIQLFCTVKERSSNAALSKAYNLRSRYVFACSLTAPLSLVLLNDGVPVVLLNLKAQLLENKGQYTEGIFRHSAESLALQAATGLIERGESLADGLAQAGFKGDAHTVAHCCAALIKLWFRNRRPSLLGTIVESQCIDRVASLVQSHSMIMGGAVSGQDTKDADIPAEIAAGEVIAALPAKEQKILLWLLDLLALILDADESNQMSAWSLAIIFGPTLYNETDQTNHLPWPNTLAQLRHCRNVTKFVMCAINLRRKKIATT